MTAKQAIPAILILFVGFLALRSPSRAQEEVKIKPTHLAILATNMGNIEIELYGEQAPKTVQNFVELAKKKYFNGILFHRVVPNFVIQGGDPFSRDSAGKRHIWGTGGTSVFGGTFADEFSPELAKIGYREGVVAMANRGPNTNTSQFFIVLSDDVAARLPYKYTIFGRVTKGMDVAHKIERSELDPAYQGQPSKAVTIVEINAVEVKPANR